MSARAFVAVVLAWGIESAARVIRAGMDDCRGWDRLCLCELLHFACPGLPVRNRLRPGPRARGGQEGADQPWRRDGR
jgi:hypothetical protein